MLFAHTEIGCADESGAATRLAGDAGYPRYSAIVLLPYYKDNLPKIIFRLLIRFGESLFLRKQKRVYYICAYRLTAMVVEADELQAELESKGELMLAVSEFDEPLEMHLHDTEIDEEAVRIELTDGVLTFDVGEVVSMWHHTHSLADFGLEE